MFHSFRVSDSFDEGPGPSSFVETIPAPLQISGLYVWYKADEGVSLSGAQVTQWDDQSGNGVNLTQKTGDIQVITGDANGYDVLEWTGLSALTVSGTPSPNSLSGAPGLTAFTVVQIQDDTTNGNRVWYFSPSFTTPNISDNYFFYVTTDTGLKTLSAAIPSGDTFSSSPQANYHIMEYFLDLSLGSNDHQFYEDGTLIAQQTDTGTTISAPGNFGLGHFNTSPPAGSESEFRLAELFLYPSALSSDDRTLLRNYLSEKYSITVV